MFFFDTKMYLFEIAMKLFSFLKLVGQHFTNKMLLIFQIIWLVYLGGVAYLCT